MAAEVQSAKPLVLPVPHVGGVFIFFRGDLLSRNRWKTKQRRQRKMSIPVGHFLVLATRREAT